MTAPMTSNSHAMTPEDAEAWNMVQYWPMAPCENNHYSMRRTRDHKCTTCVRDRNRAKRFPKPPVVLETPSTHEAALGAGADLFKPLVDCEKGHNDFFRTKDNKCRMCVREARIKLRKPPVILRFKIRHADAVKMGAYLFKPVVDCEKGHNDFFRAKDNKCRMCVREHRRKLPAPKLTIHMAVCWEDAKLLGAHLFKPIVPCAKGHNDFFRAKDNKCRMCVREKGRRIGGGKRPPVLTAPMRHSEAEALGLHKYMPLKPCAKGHHTFRYVKGRACEGCRKERAY